MVNYHKVFLFVTKTPYIKDFHNPGKEKNLETFFCLSK